MATICKIEKIVRNPEAESGRNNFTGQYPKILVWAVLGDDGHTLFETGGTLDGDFAFCQTWLKQNPQPLVKCIACEE